MGRSKVPVKIGVPLVSLAGLSGRRKLPLLPHQYSGRTICYNFGSPAQRRPAAARRVTSRKHRPGSASACGIVWPLWALG